MKLVTDSIIKYTRVPGVVALVVDHKKGIDWLYSAGFSDVPNQLPMDGLNTFRIGSTTKTMTGTVLLQLVDEGKLSLDDKLSAFFPEYPRSDEVTIAMLCDMKSGIFNYTEDEGWQIEEYETNPARKWTPQELVQIGFLHDHYFDPGTDWHYSNTNTIILGMIIEKLTGNSLQAEIENRILNPLNLKHTALLTGGTELPVQHSKGYVWDEDNNDFLDVTNVFDISWAWAAGSAYSSPRELQKYVETLVEGGFLSESLQHKRITELHQLGPNLAYGYAILKRGSFFGHNGALPGYTTSMYHSKVKNCSVVIYFNCLGDIAPDFLFYRYMNILYGQDY
ncbi:MAG: serine hydrolase [Lentimicrobiaceae bacterium]|nr:serine hydrolase [Lentimicrobiaceae bacterium]